MARVFLTRRALQDVDAIDSYSQEHWGEAVATRYLADLQAGIQRLAERPRLLGREPDFSLRLCFYPVLEHLLICDIVGVDIYILAIRHSVMDLPRRLAELEPQLVHEAELLHDRIAADDQDAST